MNLTIKPEDIHSCNEILFSNPDPVFKNAGGDGGCGGQITNSVIDAKSGAIGSTAAYLIYKYAD